MHCVRRTVRRSVWLTVLKRAAIAVLCSIAAAAEGRAETNPQPIAIPAIGTEGAATPYPSRVVVNSLGGPTHTAQISVTLHGVTHPCINELAVLLVHNGTHGYRLLSNAGGCRRLAGTDLTIASTALDVLGVNGPAGPPYGTALTIVPANFGGAPIFPAPAPAGPYPPGLPGSTTNVNGAWDLYIVDTANNNRGVVAAGWSLTYGATVAAPVDHTDVAVPDSGALLGPAAQYPLEFDLTGVSDEMRVANVTMTLEFQHPRPEHLRIVLESPQGTAVALMVAAGGLTPAPANTTIGFNDAAAAPIADAGPIVNLTYYKPGGNYIGLSVPPPGPSQPYATEFAAMAGERITGTWRLWVSDGGFGDDGVIENAVLRVTPQANTQFGIFSPEGTISSTQPFVRVEAEARGLLDTSNAMYRVTNGIAMDFYDAGPMTRIPGTAVYVANVPVAKGVNDVEVKFRVTTGDVVTDTVQIGVDEFHYTLAEGATGTFFDLDVTVANPNDTLAGIRMDFLSEGGAPTSIDVPIATASQHQQRVDDVVPAAAVSTVVRSLNALPLAIERTMIWDERGYGGHGGTAASPATRWLFAEGSQGFFNTYILLANAGAAESGVTMTFLLEGGGVVTHALTVPPGTRRTIFAGDIAGLVNQSFGLDITATQPILAERAMYLPGARLFEGGHGAAGVNRPERIWFLAEGATGSFFETFVLIGNPNNAVANVVLRYLLPTGAIVTQAVQVAANGRLTINLETVDPQLADTAVSTMLVSDRSIVVERAMYWPDITLGWQEAHNSFGLTETGLRWGVADGRIGGARDFQTYILLANPNPVAAEVEVRFMKQQSHVEIRNYTLTPTSRWNINAAADVPELGAGVFSAEVRVLNYQPIAVEKAMYWNDTGGAIWAGGTGVAATLLPPAPVVH
jgi:hypothetical protein